MARREGGSIGRSLMVGLLVLIAMGLGGAVLYLLSERNHSRYKIAVLNGNLVVLQGRMLPAGFAPFAPTTTDLQAAYAPIPLPPGEPQVAAEIFDDRADVDRALFSLLADWARRRLDSNDAGAYELAATYVHRCDLLPGLSEEQRLEMRTLRADLAYSDGRRILVEVVERLQKALDEFRLAQKLGSTRAKDVERWIADTEQRIRDYQQVRPETQAPPDTATAPSVPKPPQGEPVDGEEQPKWRL